MKAQVAKQPVNHPMLIRTPTAKAEVLRTKFELKANDSATGLNVTEGRVLIARQADESGVVVDAAQSATVTQNEAATITIVPPVESLREGLLARWRLDGDGADASGHAGALALSGDVKFGEGRVAKALDLHAAKAEVESPRMEFPPLFTLCFWLRPNPGGPARVQPLLGFSGEQAGTDDFWLTLEPHFPGSHLVFDVRGKGVIGTRAQSLDHLVRVEQWHHVAVIADSTAGRATFYVDGREATGTGGLRRDFKLAGPLLIGRRVKGGPLPFDGQLDDIRIYGRALTALEISALAEEK